jgi:hypothetical protein
MKWNISVIAMTSCRLVDQSSILAGTGINLFEPYPGLTLYVPWKFTWVKFMKVGLTSSAKVETAWSISSTRLRHLLLKHITIFLYIILWDCVVTPCSPVHVYYRTAGLTCIFLHARLAYCYNTLFLQNNN